MKNLMKWLCVVLSALMCISAFAACGKKDETPEQTTEQTAEQTREPEEQYFLDTLNVRQYGETEFVITTIDTNCAVEGNEQMNPEDPVDQKKFERDAKIFEYLGVDVLYHQLPSGKDEEEVQYMMNTILSGECNWDMLIQQADNLMSLAVNSATRDMRKMKTIQTDNTWWSQSMNKNMLFNDALYVMAGPVAEWYYGAATALAYNSEIATQFELPDISTLVMEGNWTLEEMNRICSDYGVSDKDNPVEDNKRYAISFSSGVAPYGLFPCAGGNFSTFNNDGEIVVDLNSDRNISILNKIVETFDPAKTYYGSVSKSVGTFMAKKALFLNTTVGYIENNLPGSDIKYGIIPCPKMNAEDSYVSCAWPTSNFCVAIPNTVTDARADFVGAMTEAYCFLGYEMIKPVKYDNLLLFKVATDEISSQILDMIFNNLYFDLNLVMDLGGSRTLVGKAILGRMGTFVSDYKELEGNIAKDITAYDKLTKGSN